MSQNLERVSAAEQTATRKKEQGDQGWAGASSGRWRLFNRHALDSEDAFLDAK